MKPQYLIAALFASFALAVVVLAALQLNALWSLLGGMAMVVALSAIAVVLFGKVTEARVKLIGLRYDYLKSMAGKGLMPADNSFIPIRADLLQIEPEGGSLQQSEVDQYKSVALQLIGQTYQVLGQQSKQVLPFNRCAADKIAPFDNVDIWTGAANWLASSGYADKQMRGERCVGYFFRNGQTVGDIYRRLVEPN